MNATDELNNHSGRVLGTQDGTMAFDNELVCDRPSGALDRLTETIGCLEGAVIYLEQQVNRATGLA